MQQAIEDTMKQQHINIFLEANNSKKKKKVGETTKNSNHNSSFPTANEIAKNNVINIIKQQPQ